MTRWIVGGASLLAIGGSAAAGTLQEDAKAFGTRDQVEQISMSPSGTKLAMVIAGPGSESILQVVDLGSGQAVNLTKSTGKPQSLRSCNFAGETQLVCTQSGVERFDKYLVDFEGLFAISADGTKMESLRPKARFQKAYAVGSEGSVIDFLPGSDGSILMARAYVPDVNTVGSILGKSEAGLGVDRIDLERMKVTRLEPPKGGALAYISDGRGNVRVMMMGDSNRRGQTTGRMPIKYRTKESRDWKDLGVYDSISGEGSYPLAVESEFDTLFALRKTNGRDALYRIRLDGSAGETLVASNPVVDIDSVVRLGPGQRIIGYTFADERRKVVYFDPEFAKLQASLAKAVPNQPQIRFHGATANGQKILLSASGDTNPGAFYRFDRAAKQLSPIMSFRPALEGRTLAEMKPISFPAADGTPIPAYLTIPAGSSGRNLPAVVLPHGGPAARDEWGFDWIAQFLAARGYAVVQPNFRGSEGYGDSWMKQNGFQGWQTSIADVTAAAKYLSAQGIADPNRLAILGWSYGGYAALQSAAVEPGLYKAAIAIAPLTDMAAWRDEFRDHSIAEIMKNYVGSGPHVRAGSPLQNVGSIKAPVLLFHGTRDANVSVEHSRKMNSALKSAGKSVEYVEFDNLDHQLEDSDARIQMLGKIGAFLESALGK